MCGGLHWVGYAQLAAAVSESGGIGLITALVRTNTSWIAGYPLEQSLTIHSNTPHQTQPSPEALQEEIRKCKSLTTKPFGVNLTLLLLKPPTTTSSLRDRGWNEKWSVENDRNGGALQRIGSVREAVQRGRGVRHNKCVAIRHAKSATKLGVGTWQNKSLSSRSKTHLKNDTDAISMDWFDCAGHLEYDVGNCSFCCRSRELEIPFIASGGCAMDLNLPQRHVWEQREWIWVLDGLPLWSTDSRERQASSRVGWWEFHHARHAFRTYCSINVTNNSHNKKHCRTPRARTTTLKHQHRYEIWRCVECERHVQEQSSLKRDSKSNGQPGSPHFSPKLH